MGRLEENVALVTGAGGGIGSATARLFAEHGAGVVLADVDEEIGRRVAEEISGGGGRALFQPLDVTDPDAWRTAVGLAEQRFGRLDVLVNNAGIAGGPGLEDTTLEAWERMIAVNQTGVFLGMKHAVPALRRAGGGSIVNISSISGLVGLPGSPTAYTATKGAVRLLTKSAAIDLAADGIRVNSVHPGRIQTAMTASQDAARIDFYRQNTPLGRSGTPEEVAYGVLYLASDEASFVTGSELVIDGGFTAR
jgi:NAD(P)-dependent dehydrogenase (short-subunit alcohol dehydrogenase family)